MRSGREESDESAVNGYARGQADEFFAGSRVHRFVRLRAGTGV